jgi:hypothetical protein
MHDVAQSELSPSSTAFLYAHRIAPVAKEGEMGTVSLANGSVVEATPLARMLVILALWSLQEKGAIALEPFKEKRLRFIPWTGVRARLLEPTDIGGIEGDVLRELVRDKSARDPGMDVGTIIHFLYRDRSQKVKPESLVRKRVVDDIVDHGYAERVSTDVGAVEHRLTGKARVQLEGREERIEAVEPAMERLIEQWKAFGEQQPELKEELITAVRDAFNRIQPN